MKLDRNELLSQLKLLRPALADKSPIEALTHIWFTSGMALAFNDVIAITTETSVELEGGLLGSTLLGFMERSSVQNIEITQEEGDVLLKIAGAKLRLSLCDLEKMISPFPELEGNGVTIGDEFCAAIRHVMTSLGGSGAYENAGVTVMQEDDVLAFYATDGKSISWARTPLPEGYDLRRVVLSPVFCEQMLSLCRDGGELFIFDDSAVARAASGPLLFGRLLEPPKELDFAGTLASAISDAAPTPVPDKLTEALDRALLLCVGGEPAKVSATVDNDVLRLAMTSSLGQLHEAIRLTKPVPPKVEARIDAALVQRGLRSGKMFTLNARCMALLGEGDYGYVAASPGE